jgi:aminoglycoside 3-N-acetyltransferase I
MPIPVLNVLRVNRLDSDHWQQARQLFSLMAAVFEEDSEALSERYLRTLLDDRNFWALAAYLGDAMIGGVTAHSLPMTRCESSEIFIFDIAVQGAYQKRGVGRKLIESLRNLALESGIHEIFVATDNKDAHALDFYKRLGGVSLASTLFSFTKV